MMDPNTIAYLLLYNTIANIIRPQKLIMSRPRLKQQERKISKSCQRTNEETRLIQLLITECNLRKRQDPFR